MVTFNFSNITGDAWYSAFFEMSDIFSTSSFTTVTRAVGANPLIVTSHLTGEGLPNDTMVFTLTPISTVGRVFFRDIWDVFDLSRSKGTFGSPVIFTLAFDAGNSLDALSNVAISGNFLGASALWITEGGFQPVNLTSPTFAGVITGIRFAVVGGTINLTSITGTPTCFARDTMIATPTGSRAVQFLNIGDKVLTHDGETREVLWLGRQSFDTRAGVPDHLRPVRISAGALGEGLPKRDLVVTGDHALLIDGLLINASALVNGDTILWDAIENTGKRLTVFHVETEDHAVILAEGCAAETYVDVATRANFDNYQQYLDLYGTERIIPENRRPRISSARLVPQGIKDRLGLVQAGELAA